MNCRDFLNEFDEREPLTKTATLHLKKCRDCRKINGVQTRVWQIIDKFEKIDAPKDFDFRLKARIANSKANDFQPRFLPALRYVLPLIIVGLIFSFVVFRAVYSTANESAAPQTAENNLQRSLQTENTQVENFPSGEIAAANVSQPFANEKMPANETKNRRIENKKETETTEDKVRIAAVKSLKKPNVQMPKTNEKNSVGSRDSALSSTRVFTPKGINPNQIVKDREIFEKANSITAEQILSQLGIETVSKNKTREVKTIRQNSVAARSGVKVGDVIEQIGDETPMNKQTRSKTIQIKKITVLRGTEKIEIPLHN